MKSKKRELHHILDEELRITRWPSRNELRKAAMLYLASKFEAGQKYTEQAVNALLRRWTSFDDPALLRRELYERGLIERTRDCREYWRVQCTAD